MTKQNKKPVPKKVKKVKSSSPRRDWLATVNDKINIHHKKIMAGLFALSLVLSIIYYLQAWNSPIASYYKWTNSDMSFFDTWAQYIADEDWACDTALHPYHSWHDDLAKEYFKQFPDVRTEYASKYPSADEEALKKALINDIYKGKTYHQEPLYAYLLAVTYSIFGYDHKWVFFWQFLMAAFTSVLVYLIGKRVFSPITGLLAALFVTLCGSIMVYEMVLLRTTMTSFFTVLVLYLFLKVLADPSWKKQLLFGVASGFALLGQSYLILFLIPAWIGFFINHRKRIKEVAPGFAIGIGAMLVVMLPLFIRNIKADVPVTAMASQGAMAYIPMNIKNSFPMESFYVHMPSLAYIRHETGGKMMKAVGECLKTFENFNDFIKLYTQKINGMFMWYEIPNNMNYYLFREIAPVLKMLPVHYFFIAPLGIAGFLFGLWRYRWKIYPLVVMTIISMAPLMIAGNLARYRTPLVILLCIFAAYILIEIWNMMAQKNYKPALIGLGLIILAWLYTASTVEKKIFVYNASDFDTFYRYHYQDTLTELERTADHDAYLRVTTDMVSNIPEYFLTVPLQQPIIKSNEAECSRYIANFLETHYNILTFLQRNQEAAFYQDRVKILRERRDDFNRRAGIQ